MDAMELLKTYGSKIAGCLIGAVLGAAAAASILGLLLQDWTGGVRNTPLPTLSGSPRTATPATPTGGGTPSPDRTPAASGAPTAAATPSPIVIADGEFAPADWTLEVIERCGSTATATREPTGGDPGAYRHLIHVVPAVTPGCDGPTILTRHLYAPGGVPATYAPAVQGPIAAIDVAEDRAVFRSDPAYDGAAVGSLFLVSQGGCVGHLVLPNAAGEAWTRAEATGLGASDLVGCAFDFSAAGGPLSFGFGRSNTNGSPNVAYLWESGIDDWTATIHRAAP